MCFHFAMANTRAKDQVRFGTGLYSRAVLMSVQFTQVLRVKCWAGLLKKVGVPVAPHARRLLRSILWIVCFRTQSDATLPVLVPANTLLLKRWSRPTRLCDHQVCVDPAKVTFYSAAINPLYRSSLILLRLQRTYLDNPSIHH